VNKKTVRDLDVRGKRVLVRVDFNVPIKDGKVSDDTRIQAALPTLRYLLEQGAALVLASHLGRPKGGPDPAFSLAPVAEHLSTLLGKPVRLAPGVAGPEVEAQARALQPGEILMLENTRFEKGEEQNDPQLAEALARLADLYVNDAFGSAHRAHASTDGVARHLPAAAGFLMEKELDYLGRALAEPARPFVAILGGAKISDKIGVIESLLGRCDRLLIGGGMANTFLRAQGHELGDSLVEESAVEQARDLLGRAGDKLVLPVDVVIADAFAADARTQVVPAGDVPSGWRVMDIGPQTVARFREALQGARLVVWNGPMGVFELQPFAEGTNAVARLVAESGATSIIGGGDSAAAVEQAGLAERMSHISTGGGASLEFLEGRTLPGVAALNDR
jgi:phosphoglycerate kinase